MREILWPLQTPTKIMTGKFFKIMLNSQYPVLITLNGVSEMSLGKQTFVAPIESPYRQVVIDMTTNLTLPDGRTRKKSASQIDLWYTTRPEENLPIVEPFVRYDGTTGVWQGPAVTSSILAGECDTVEVLNLYNGVRAAWGTPGLVDAGPIPAWNYFIQNLGPNPILVASVSPSEMNSIVVAGGGGIFNATIIGQLYAIARTAVQVAPANTRCVRSLV